MSAHFPQQDKQRSSWVDALIFVVLGICGFYLIPGILVVEFARSLTHSAWDVGQMWTFSFLVSVVLHVTLSVIRGGAFRGFRSHMGVGFLCIAALLVAHFGFKAEWPDRAYKSFVGGFFNLSGDKQAAAEGPGSASSPAQEFLDSINAQVGRNLRYPPKAQRDGEAGNAIVRLSIKRNGQIASVEIQKSAGYPSLDEEAVAVFQRIGNLGAVPASAQPGHDPITVIEPVNFKLAE